MADMLDMSGMTSTDVRQRASILPNILSGRVHYTENVWQERPGLHSRHVGQMSGRPEIILARTVIKDMHIHLAKPLSLSSIRMLGTFNQMPQARPYRVNEYTIVCLWLQKLGFSCTLYFSLKARMCNVVINIHGRQ